MQGPPYPESREGVYGLVGVVDLMKAMLEGTIPENELIYLKYWSLIPRIHR